MVEANPEQQDEWWIGIDLGTTTSACAIWRNDKIEVLQNKDDGLPTTPSIVTYTMNNKNDILIGNPASKAVTRFPENTVYDAKRMIGRPYDDPMIEEEQKRWPFEVVRGDNNRPMIKITDPKKKKEP